LQLVKVLKLDKSAIKTHFGAQKIVGKQKHKKVATSKGIPHLNFFVQMIFKRMSSLK
jgi:hypothetical protein